jgi:hypothetical protein
VYIVIMPEPLTANDLLPLVAKLSREEQIRLAQLTLRAARDSSLDAAAYRATPVYPDELSRGDDDGAAWEAEGWEHATDSDPAAP